MGGSMQGRLWPRSDDERERAEKAGYDISKVSWADFELQCRGIHDAVTTAVVEMSRPLWALPALCCVSTQSNQIYPG